MRSCNVLYEVGLVMDVHRGSGLPQLQGYILHHRHRRPYRYIVDKLLEPRGGNFEMVVMRHQIREAERTLAICLRALIEPCHAIDDLDLRAGNNQPTWIGNYTGNGSRRTHV